MFSLSLANFNKRFYDLKIAQDESQIYIYIRNYISVDSGSYLYLMKLYNINITLRL